MKKTLLPFILLLLFNLLAVRSFAQLDIVSQSGAAALAQKLVGAGVTISNATFTGNRDMAALFYNRSNTNIGIDSGIVLTNGYASSNASFTRIGVNGNGIDPADQTLADRSWGLPGDANLSTVIGAVTRDACVLEFDFVPFGDSIKFNYVFSSEEYTPQYVCSFNDAFAFLISGPGITGLKNIALIPNTTTPVTILNVNNIPDGQGPGGSNCVNNPTYYLDNTSNAYFTHDGQTVVLTALEKVQPCQTYHLKLVIADAGADDAFDSGVFLEAGSLSSNVFQMQNQTQIDPVSGLDYLVEGCVAGVLKIKREKPSSFPQTINLSYSGTVVNGVDIQLLPPAVTIPSGQTEVSLNIIPLIDGIPEGVEKLEVNILAPCSVGPPTVVAVSTIQIRDFDILTLTPDSIKVCRNAPVPLSAGPGYTTYTWDPNPTLSNTNTANPTAIPVAASTTYYCTATIGTCNARDSAFVRIKDIELLSKTGINCKAASTGQIKVSAGPEWATPLQYSINQRPFQSTGTFNNLPVDNYWVKIQDNAGCLDSIQVSLTQLFPDLSLTSAPLQATCSGNADGKITVTAAGGKAPYQYSSNNGTSFQASNIFNVKAGTYQLLVKDANGCTFSSTETVTLNDDLVVDAGTDATICEGTGTTLQAISNGTAFTWTPAGTLTGIASASPVASPIVTTKYYVTAKKGICSHIDSVMVFVDPAPKPDAGTDITICFGASTNLAGSGGVEYTWSPATFLANSTDPATRVNRPTENSRYYLHVKDAKGCSSIKPDTVNLRVTPAVRISAGRDTMIAFNQPLQLRATELGNSGVTSYIWTPSYGLNNPNIRNPVARLDRDMTYTVTGKTPADCEGSDEVFIKAYKGPDIYVPTAFTPNGDARNDELRAVAIGMKEYHYFTIYNRSGQVVFTTKDFSRGWDGRFKGIEQGPSTYIWIAESVDFTGKIVQRKGSTILLR